MTAFSESIVADPALAWLEALGCAMPHGPDVAASKLLRSDALITTRMRKHE